MSVTISIKVRRGIAELADKMVKYGLARSKSHAFNTMIEKGLNEVLKEVKLWDHAYEKVKEFEERDYKLKHGGLTKLLEEDRAKWYT